MTTLAELVDAEPDPARGVVTQLSSGSGVWRFVVELADPAAGSSVEWYDITELCQGYELVYGSDGYAGRYRAAVAELDLTADGDQLAPWNTDTSATFGTHVDLGAGLIIRAGFIRVVSAAVAEWVPRFTCRVESWRDATYARGQIRRHQVTCRDLMTGLINVPTGSDSPNNWIARVEYLLTEAAWPFGHTIYGADQTTAPADVLELPASDESDDAAGQIDAACDPAGAVWYTDRKGRLIVRPQVGDNWHAALFGAGATGTPWVDADPVVFSYTAEDDGGVAYVVDGVEPFGIDDTELYVINNVRVTDPTSPPVYDADSPTSIQRYGRRARSVSWQIANDLVADDIVARLAFATKQATPLDTDSHQPGFFPTVAALEWLHPVTVRHSTGAGRAVVTADGHLRQITEGVIPLADESIEWHTTITVDVETYDTAAALLPVEDLTVTDGSYDWAEFGWTNPAQTPAPTETWVRMANQSLIWLELDYPMTELAWLGLEPDTAYQFDVRLVRRVDGLIVAVSPVRSVAFATPATPGPIVVPDPGDGFDVTLPDVDDPVDCEIAWTLEGFDGMVWVEIDSGTDPGGTVLDFDAGDVAGYYLYNLCTIEMCTGEPPGAEHCVSSAVAVCVTPPGYTNTDPPYDDADLMAFIPEVCPIDIVKEAISGDAGFHGPAWGGLVYVGADDIAIEAGPVGGVVAYGETAALTYTGAATIGCRVSVQTDDETGPLFAVAGIRLECVGSGTSGWYPQATVTTALGETITVTDPTERALITAVQLYATYDDATGEIVLWVDGSSVGSDTAEDSAARAAQGAFWRVGAPAGSWITDCAVFDSVLALGPLTLPYTTNLYAWWDFSQAGSLTLDGSNLINNIADLSGNGNNLAQTNAGRRPPEPTGTPASSNFTADEINATTLTTIEWWTNRALTVLVVSDGDNSAGTAYFSLSGDTAATQDHQWLSFRHGIVEYGYGGLYLGDGSLLAKTWTVSASSSALRVTAVRISTSAVTVREDGTNKTLTASSGSMAQSSFLSATVTAGLGRIGGRCYVTDQTSNYRFGEVIMFAEYVSDGDMATLESYLMSKWGI